MKDPLGTPPGAPPRTELTLDVGAVAHGGHCVARAPDGRVVFVRHALPGERVVAVVTEERRGYLRADAVTVLTASPDRVAPPCRYAGTCGGCDFQHVAPAAQRELKATVVREQLVRLGGLSPAEAEALLPTVAELPGGAVGWRSRVRYAVDDAGRPGFREHRSHRIVPVDRCLLAVPEIAEAEVTGARWPGMSEIVVAAASPGEPGDPAGSEPAAAAARAMVEPTVVARPVAPAGTDAAADGRRRHRQGRGRGRASGAAEAKPRVVSGPATLVEHAAGRTWAVSATGFWQVHRFAADALVASALELLAPQPGERALDLYAGVGLFAGPIAERVGPTGAVVAVEGDAPAAATAKRNLADLPWVEVLAARVDRALGSAAELDRDVDLVLLDPPRAGAGAEVVAHIVARRPRAVCYVACDPAALARDVRTFRTAGWRLAALRACDAFPMTHHVECIALLVPYDPRDDDWPSRGKG